MGFIPCVKELLPDELLYSWVYRLAKANCMTLHSFIQAYMNNNAKQDEDVPFDLRKNFSILYYNLNLNIDMAELFLKTSIFSYESIAMTKELQTKYINNVFYKIDAINTVINYSFSTLNICPKCFQEDMEKYNTPYFHRSHQLRGIYICHKHGVKLLSYKGKIQNLGKFDIEDYKIIEANIDVKKNNILSKFAHELLNANLNTNIQVIKKRLTGYENSYLKKDIFNSYSLHTSDLLPVLFTISKGNIAKLREIIEVDSNFQISKNSDYEMISGKKLLLKTFKHEKCNRIFCITEYGFNIGWQCPYCLTALSYQERFERMVKEISKEEYCVVSNFRSMNLPVKIKHLKCGEIFDINPRSFVMERVRCKCNTTITFNDAKQNIQKCGNFKLINYINTTENITVKSLDCGHLFSVNYHKFINSPHCRICKPKNMTIDFFKKKIKECTNDDYEVLDSYIDYFHKVTFRHKKCGNIFQCTPKYFFENPHCPYCSKQYAEWNNMFDILYDYKQEFGNVDVPKRIKYKGSSLGRWCMTQRNNKKMIIYLKKKKKKLKSIGFVFDPLEEQWNRKYELYRKYINEHQTTYIPRRYIYMDEKLGMWVDTQKKRYKEKKLSKERIEKILELNINFFDDR